MNRPQTYELDTKTRKDSVVSLRSKSFFNGGQIVSIPRDGATGQKKIMIAGKKLHLIGAGGIGMSGLAVLLMK